MKNQALWIVGGVVVAAIIYNRYKKNQDATVAAAAANDGGENDVAEEASSFAGGRRTSGIGQLNRSIGRSRFGRRGRLGLAAGRSGVKGAIAMKTCVDGSTVPATRTRVPLTSPCPSGSRDSRKAITA